MSEDDVTRHTWYRSTGKRVADLVAGATLLVVLSPVMLLTAACVRALLGSPVFFKQERAGIDGLAFTLVKFRSMRPETDAAGRSLTVEQRLTRLGRFLRKSSLDEFPELWNVVRGEMSLVGPRPLLMRYNDRYSAEQARRLTVRPGITGWAQIHGRNDTTWTERLERDVWYVDHISPLVDLIILARTVPAVLRGSGVTPQGESLMPEFMGEESETISTDALRT